MLDTLQITFYLMTFSFLGLSDKLNERDLGVGDRKSPSS